MDDIESVVRLHFKGALNHYNRKEESRGWADICRRRRNKNCHAAWFANGFRGQGKTR